MYVAYTYIGFNIIGFLVNAWVLFVVGPLLFTSSVKVPKSILFYIITLCISDLIIMIGRLFVAQRRLVFSLKIYEEYMVSCARVKNLSVQSPKRGICRMSLWFVRFE